MMASWERGRPARIMTASRERGRPARTMMASRERGRPARTMPGTASPIPPTWINRQRCHGCPSAWPMGFPPKGWLPAASHSSSAAATGTGCGRDARAPRVITPPLRGSRRSRAARRRLMRWGVSGGRLLRMPTCTLWETPVCPQVQPPLCRADHSRKNSRSLMKMNHEWTRKNTNRPEDRWTCFNHKRHQHASATCALGVTMSWDEGFPGARASRPHQAWHSLGHLPHLDQPATAPWLSFGLADGVPAHRVAACGIALKLSGGQRERMRASRPRSPGQSLPREGESQKPSRQAKADAVGGERRVTSQNKEDL